MIVYPRGLSRRLSLAYTACSQIKGIFNVLVLGRRGRMNTETLKFQAYSSNGNPMATLFARPITNRSLASKLVGSPKCGDILSCTTNVRTIRYLFEDQQRGGTTLYQVNVSVLSLVYLHGQGTGDSYEQIGVSTSSWDSQINPMVHSELFHYSTYHPTPY